MVKKNCLSVRPAAWNYSALTGRKKVKCKVIPLQAWTGPECSRRLRLPDFKKIGTRRW